MAGMKNMSSKMKNAGKDAPQMDFKPQNVGKTIKRLFGYLGKYRVAFIAVTILIAFSSICNILGTYMLNPLLNVFAEEGSYNPDALESFFINWLAGGESIYHNMTYFGKLIIIMGCIYAFGVCCNYANERIMVSISVNTLNRLRTDMFNNMEDLPIKRFDRRPHGEIMSTYTNDTDLLREMISSSIPSLISSFFNMVGFLVAMITLNWMLIIICALQIVTNLVVVKVIGSKSRKNFVAQQESVAKVNGYVEEMMDGQKVIKVFNHEPFINSKFDEINHNLAQSSYKAQAFASCMGPIMNNVAHIFYAITVAVGALMVFNVVDGKFTLGIFSVNFSVAALVTFLEYSRRFSQPISQIGQQANTIIAATAGAERIFALIDEPKEEDTGYVTLVNCNVEKDGTITECQERTGSWAWKHPHEDGTITYTLLRGDVRFEDVTFGYVPEKIVLHNVSFFAKPGQKVALVGSTGAGKTTITNLINCFYRVPDGKIRYDGININKIKKDDLRRSLAMVLQDTHLFTGTVMDNIRYGRLDATDEECIEAAKLANADFFISHLPDGYQTMLTSDGANLSQGQRQLLSIARAAVANPPVLILDEATSSIDTRTEKHIEQGMDALMKGRTTFVIAHRLSTVRNSDAILVLEKGEIIERGNHDELIAQKGRYYQLYTGMFELE